MKTKYAESSLYWLDKRHHFYRNKRFITQSNFGEKQERNPFETEPSRIEIGSKTNRNRIQNESVISSWIRIFFVRKRDPFLTFRGWRSLDSHLDPFPENKNIQNNFFINFIYHNYNTIPLSRKIKGVWVKKKFWTYIKGHKN